MQKLQRDMAFLQEVIFDTMSEISSKGSFTALLHTIETWKDEKNTMEEIILKSVIQK